MTRAGGGGNIVLVPILSWIHRAGRAARSGSALAWAVEAVRPAHNRRSSMDLNAPRMLATAAIVASLFTSPLAHAAPVVLYASGLAVGIQDLLVDGVFYAVDFRFGSYDAIFATDNPTFLGNALGANHAADSMMAVLNAEAPPPRIGNGSAIGGLWVVYADIEVNQNDPNQYTAKQLGYQGPTWQRFGDFSDFKSADRTSLNDAFAVFTPQPVSIPEPGSVALVAVGLIGAAACRRRKG
jgi:hypothetical protein